MSEHKEPIPSRIYNAAEGGNVCGVEDIFDDAKGKSQKEINTEVEQIIGNGGAIDERIQQAVSGKVDKDGNKGLSANDYTNSDKDKLSLLPSKSSYDSTIDSINTRIAALQAMYQDLNDKKPVPIAPTDTWPVANPQEGVVYRVTDRVNTPPEYYSDYMWDGNGTSASDFIEMARYSYSADDEPIRDSNNLLKSKAGYNSSHTVFPSKFIIDACLHGNSAIVKKSTSKNGGNVRCAVTDYIPCSNGDSIYIIHSLVADSEMVCAIYNQDKELLETSNYSNAGGYKSFTINNANAAYIRATVIFSKNSFVKVSNNIYYLGCFVSETLDDAELYLPNDNDAKPITSNAVAKEFIRKEGKHLSITPGADNTLYATKLDVFGLRPGDVIRAYSKIDNRPHGGSLSFLDSNKTSISGITLMYQQYDKTARVYARIPDNAVYVSAYCGYGIDYDIEVLDYFAANSSYVTEELKTTLHGLNINVPSMPDIPSITSVSNAEELLSAIESFNEGNTSLTIVLTADIALNPANLITINNDTKNLVIIGNGHSIYPKGGESYEPEGYVGSYAYSTYSVTPSYGLVTENGDLVEQGRTKPQIALSGVLNEDGTTPTQSGGVWPTGVKKILLPHELRGLTITQEDNVYINFVADTDYSRKSELVTKIEDNYLFFNQTSSYNPNALTNTHFRLYNVPDGEGWYTRNNKVYYPSKYTKLYCPIYSGSIITLTNTSGKVAFYDVIFKSFIRFNGAMFSTNNGGTLIVQRCKFIGAYTGFYENGSSAGYLYIDNCYFENIKTFGNYSGNNHVIITNCKSYNVGTCEYNFGQHFRVGGSSSYIGHNELINYGYAGIMCSSSTCVVEKNVLKYTPEYAEYAKIGLVRDSGAIYTGQLDTNCIIRYNKIINYAGPGSNHAIYLDDGVYNVTVIGNIVENLVSKAGYAIFARRVSDTENYKNTNRIIAYNIVESGIRLEGSTRNTPNGCYLGYNIICKKVSRVECYFGDLQGEEPQFITNDVFVTDGIVKSRVDLESWLNK